MMCDAILLEIYYTFMHIHLVRIHYYIQKKDAAKQCQLIKSKFVGVLQIESATLFATQY